MKGNWFMFVAAAVLGLSLGLVGCGGGDSDKPAKPASPGAGSGDASAQKDLTGNVKIDGSSTVYPISAAVADEFKSVAPNVKVEVAFSGTGGGFSKFAEGETDVSNASRPIKGKERAAVEAAGIEFVEIPVAYDGLTIVVNNSNTWAKELTVDQLRKIFLAPGAKTWKDVDPNFPATEIKLYAPGEASGTYDYFTEVVAGKKNKETGKHKYGEYRERIEKSEDDHVIVNGVVGDEGAIGFFGAAYYFENEDKLRAVAIQNKAGEYVLPSAPTIESGKYNPFSRPLFIYVSKKSLNRPEVKKFVDFYLLEGPELAGDVGYVSLPKSVYDVAKRKVKDLETGSVYLDADGNKKPGSVTELYE